MTRGELIRMFVLSEISDDYEEPEHIFDNVSKRARICGIDLKPEDIRAAVLELIGFGLAKAYRLSTRDPVVEVQGVPPSTQFADYYFLITEKGRGAHSTWRKEWPLDDEDSLLPGWVPPTD